MDDALPIELPPDPPVMSSCSAVSEPLVELLPIALPLSVAEHLNLARVAHVRYRELHDRTDNSDEAAMTAAIQEARDARLAALALDPQQHDPAWQVDVFEGKSVPHAELLAFYESYLAAD